MTYAEVRLRIWCEQCAQTNTIPLWIGDGWYCYNCGHKDVITEGDVLDNIGELLC